MAGNVSVTYDEMDTAAGRLNKTKDDIEAALADAKAQITSLVSSGFVTDAASKQFDDSFDEFKRGMSQVNEGLDSMASFLTSAAKAFRDTDHSLASALNKG